MRDNSEPVYFTRFTEHNDWEGEVWTFWLQVNRNERELVDLFERTEPDRETYDMQDPTDSDEWITEDEVDLLVRYSDDGYMPTHTKVPGRLHLTDETTIIDLYKGGVRELFS